MNTFTNQRSEQAQATRERLIAAARRMFAQTGYHATGTPELVAAASVTRGALYHHFRDKEHLFEAVFLETAQELFDAASAEVGPLSGDRWRQLQQGLQTYLRLIAQSREIQRILLVDGPSVLGWPKWRELQSAFSLGSLIESVGYLIEGNVIRPLSPLAGAHLILAALNEAALMISHSETPEATRLEVGEVLQRLVAGLR